MVFCYIGGYSLLAAYVLVFFSIVPLINIPSFHKDNRMGLDEKFGLPTLIKEKELVELDTDNLSAAQDFEVARSNMNKLVSLGTNAVKELADLAGPTQLPEFYIALSAMMKSTALAASTLIKLHEQRESLKNPEEKTGVPKETHSHIHFQGSTADLNEFVTNLGKKK